MKRLAALLLLAAALVACDPPTSSGYFDTLPPGATLPSGAACADRVHRSGWEPRADNDDENHTTPPNDFVLRGYAGMDASVWQRVTGDFTGTTDEILQWAACKWGLSDNLARAEAVVESNWHMSQVGDAGSCSSDPSSIGIFQIKWCQHPGTHEWSRRSTAFNADYWGAVIRGCVDGDDYVRGGTVEGCVRRWFSGAWMDSGSAWYWRAVQDELAAKRWLGWEG